jgi:hypothetical protein
LLVSDYINPANADALRNHGIAFLDAAGNGYLQDPPVHIFVKGERPERIVASSGGGRSFSPSGLAVVLAVLCRPTTIDKPYRTLATLAGVAHGSVGWVIPELERLGFISGARRARRLFNVPELFDRWVEAYLRVLRPKRLLGRYSSGAPNWWQTIDLAQHGAHLSGEPAAVQLDKLASAQRTTIYVQQRLEPRLVVGARLRKDEAGDVDVFRRFWAFDPSSKRAPMPVIYADLVATGDARCLEAAAAIREDFLARPDAEG